MARPILLFIISTILTIATFYFKSEHHFDLLLVIPVGLYFITAYLLAFRPPVENSQKYQFAGLAMLVWIVLFGISYNLLFFIIAPISGGLGAWLIVLLSRKYLGLPIARSWPVIVTGVCAALLGIGFMILVKQSASIGVKAGLLTGLWQVGVGLMIANKINEPLPMEEEEEGD